MVVPLLAAPLAVGCASARGTYGEHARFSPAFQGYVMSADEGSDDPSAGDTVLLLRDPLTGNKLQCEEDVVEWRELYEDVAVDQVHDRNTAIAVGVTTGVFFGPLVAAHPLGAALFVGTEMTADNLYDLFRSESAPELFEAGVGLYQRKRFPQASLAIERALAKDSSIGVLGEAYLFLGLSYAEQGRNGRAAEALSLFVDRAAVRDVNAYRKAEETLRTLGVARAECASREPVQLFW
jgi:tetratricopeptide (TPR) repeat protein